MPLEVNLASGPPSRAICNKVKTNAIAWSTLRSCAITTLAGLDVLSNCHLQHPVCEGRKDFRTLLAAFRHSMLSPQL